MEIKISDRSFLVLNAIYIITLIFISIAVAISGYKIGTTILYGFFSFTISAIFYNKIKENLILYDTLHITLNNAIKQALIFNIIIMMVGISIMSLFNNVIILSIGFILTQLMIVGLFLLLHFKYK